MFGVQILNKWELFQRVAACVQQEKGGLHPSRQPFIIDEVILISFIPSELVGVFNNLAKKGLNAFSKFRKGPFNADMAKELRSVFHIKIIVMNVMLHQLEAQFLTDLLNQRENRVPLHGKKDGFLKEGVAFV